MASHDLHESPKVTPVAKATVDCGQSQVQLSLVRHQRSKTDEWYSLHATISRMVMENVTIEHFLKILGFRHFSHCQFIEGACYAIEVSALPNLGDFSSALATSSLDFLTAANLFERATEAGGGHPTWGDGHTGGGFRPIK